ncbi:MAG: acyl-CoA dehydrogenase family protein [Deltaproteobacteria bacterium]|nr:acyl-CoA dehydrogenase family protein [Deltaproteobacteria bacterium]
MKKTAHNFLSKECPKELVRELDESDRGYSPELWQKMAELGWMGDVALPITSPCDPSKGESVRAD